VISAAPDNSKLVYKGCANQPLPDPNGVYSSSLSAIFGTLIQQSSKSKFYKTTSGSVSGLFQCRGDLSNVDCYTCVSRLPILMDKLCGKTVAARIQVLGCYMLYEVSGFAQISGMELLYKTCGKTNGGFQQRRDAAFSALESVVVYPKVKVIIQDEEEEEYNPPRVYLKHPSSYDHPSNSPEHKDGYTYTPPYVRLPISTSPMAMGKANRESNSKSASVLPPRAVLSSPENDAIHGAKIKKTQGSGLKNHNLSQNRHVKCTKSYELDNRRRSWK
ncbi:hypothetical protein M8C21_003960, partial [Ambrosia artemisiifolia]